MPHGTIRSKYLRSVLTLRAKPWKVTHCFTWMPMLAIFRPSGPHPGQAGVAAPASTPSAARAVDQRRFELAQIPVQVVPVLPEIEDRDSRRAAPARDRSRRRRARPRRPRRPAAPAPRCNGRLVGAGAAAERDHRVVLDQQQDVLVSSPADPLAAELRAAAPALRGRDAGRDRADASARLTPALRRRPGAPAERAERARRAECDQQPDESGAGPRSWLTGMQIEHRR